MKILITLFTVIATFTSAMSYGAQALDIALEMKSFKAEYYSSSNRGVITVSDCSQCKKDTYHFDANVKILKNNQSITIDQFVNDYWNAEYPTIFLNPETKSITLIAY